MFSCISNPRLQRVLWAEGNEPHSILYINIQREPPVAPHILDALLEQTVTCCKEVVRVRALMPEVRCITAHETFSQACLNVHTLEVAYCILINYHPCLPKALQIHRYVVSTLLACIFSQILFFFSFQLGSAVPHALSLKLFPVS